MGARLNTFAALVAFALVILFYAFAALVMMRGGAG